MVQRNKREVSVLLVGFFKRVEDLEPIVGWRKEGHLRRSSKAWWTHEKVRGWSGGSSREKIPT